MGLAGKKGYGSHDGASPHHSLTIERDNLSEDLTDEELLDKAEELHRQCEERVKRHIAQDLKNIKEMP